MDPSSVCRLHPGVAVTGFCPACLRDRLAGLQPPPSSADLRRCKSFSYARSAAAAAAASHAHLLEPQRRSCDLFGGQQLGEAPAPAPEEEPAAVAASRTNKSLAGLLGKKLQQWRRKNKKAEMPAAAAGRQHGPCGDVDPGRASWDARSLGGPAAPPVLTMLSGLAVEEDEDMDMAPAAAVPRSDGQIPVEEDYYFSSSLAAVPGGTAQTRDYYLDSSSSSRRRRSVDRSSISGRNSFSDANNINGGSRVSPAMAIPAAAAASERLYSYHEVHHHQYCSTSSRDLLQHNLRPDDYLSGSFGSAAFRGRGSSSCSNKAAGNKPSKKQGIKGWSIWGLIHRKSSSRNSEAAADPDPTRPSFSSSAAAGDEYPWPHELRARGYNGQMLRCNSSISARSSFSGGAAAAMMGGSGRRSISGVEMAMHDEDASFNNGHGASNGRRRTRRADEVLLERNQSARPVSYPHHPDHHPPAMPYQHHQFSSRPPPNPHPPAKGRRRPSSSKHELASLPRRSVLGLYSTEY